MSMAKMFRVLLDQQVYDALRAESMMKRKSLKDTLADIVIQNLSPDAQNILGIMGCMDEAFLNRIKKAKEATSYGDIKAAEAIISEDKMARKTAKTIEEKKMLLRTDSAAQKKILEMKADGCTYAEIARKVRYPISTVRAFWIRHKKELPLTGP